LSKLISRLRSSVSQLYEPVSAVAILERVVALLAAVPPVPEAGVVPLEEAEVRALRVLGAQEPEACQAFVYVPIKQNCRRRLRTPGIYRHNQKTYMQKCFLSLIGPAMWSSPV